MDLFDCLQYVGFVVSFCDLFVTFSAYLESEMPTDSSPSQAKQERCTSYLKKNWDIFTADIHTSVINRWKYVAGNQ